MALWTDPTRTYLIQEVSRSRVIWDRDLASDGNIKMLKQQAFQEVSHAMNGAFPNAIKYTSEDVRAQWKNLKDTYVRKQRYMNEGKYAYDNTKEPTWKFFRMLSFLDEKKERSFLDISVLQRDHVMDLVKNEHYENSNQSAASSEEQMMSMFAYSQGDKTPAPPETPPTPSLPQVVSQSPSIQIIATKQGGTHSTAASGDEDDEPRRKRPYHRRSNQTTPCRQDEFELFGSLTASQLRRMADEHSRSAALCLQKKINDMIFDYQMSLLNQNHSNHLPTNNHIQQHGTHNAHPGHNNH